jgi:hypothetical protein
MDRHGRAECLDWLLIVGRGRLEQVLRVYTEHYNRHRPHRALRLEAPDRPAGLTVVGEDHRTQVYRRDLLGGLHERISAPHAPPWDSKVEALPVRTAVRSAQSDRS